jgi:hypothetical protein
MSSVQTSAEVGTILMLVLFSTSLVVSWIATVFVMDGSLNNRSREKGRDYEKRSRGVEG